MNLKSFDYIDIHTHTNFAAFDPVVDFGIAPKAHGSPDAKIHYGVDADRDEVIRRALDAGVAMINVGTQKDTSRKAVEIAERYERGVYAIVGVHPIHTSKSYHDAQELGEPFDKAQGALGFASRGEVFDYEYYKKLASHPKVVGIGECGLDYYRSLEVGKFGSFEVQEKAFREQIELAIEVGKPLMLHLRSGSGRSAYKDAFDILSAYGGSASGGKSRTRGNLHFFAGSIEEAKPFLDAGFSFSFTGVITFTRDYDELIRYLPLDRILSETDSPYVAPAPFRGKRNEPLYVREVVKAIARIRGEDEEKVRAQIIRNTEELFGIPFSI